MRSFAHLPKTPQWLSVGFRTNSKFPTKIWTFPALQPQLPTRPNFQSQSLYFHS